MDSARHVIGCHVTRERRVQNSFDDVASTIHQCLPEVAEEVPERVGAHEAGGMSLLEAATSVSVALRGPAPRRPAQGEQLVLVRLANAPRASE